MSGSAAPSVILRKLGTLTALGAAIGTTIGAALGDVASGIVIGAALGGGVGVALEWRRRRSKRRA